MSKIRRRKCKSIREYKKLSRKYCKYFNRKHIQQDYYRDYWYTWMWIDFLDPWDKELIAWGEQWKEKGYPNLSLIIKEVQDNYNWSYKNLKFVDSIFYLKGIEVSNEDYYYIYVNSSGEKEYMTCVGGFKDILYGKYRIEC